MIGNYTFSQKNGGRNWYCSQKKGTNCKARVAMDVQKEMILSYSNDHNHEPKKYVISKSGKYLFDRTEFKFISTGSKYDLLMIGNYTFSQKNGGRNWYCSQRRTQCKARVAMDAKKEIILSYFGDHNHEPKKYVISKSGKYLFDKKDYILIPSGQKNQLLMLDGFTFAQMHSKRHWYCSKKKAGCKAKIKMDVDLVTVIESYRTHNHQPPEYYVTKAGDDRICDLANQFYVRLYAIKYEEITVLCYSTNAPKTTRWHTKDIPLPVNFEYYSRSHIYTNWFEEQVAYAWRVHFCTSQQEKLVLFAKENCCKAKVKMNPDGVTIMNAMNFHNHKAPQYVISECGEYVFIRSRSK
ncbi:hypothetical protein HF086_014284 [Spodoptera exigua]|uniref:FLYWCH-type domain-containing protein n=1 Tax=Spodoptera exigua TaxID=7107 RepID=A0A922M777_SPOEX|nr:hypothetical protein HF086_014284 [Spodoptera exigua]